MLARLLKLLHELGSIGTLGAVAVCLLLLWTHRSGPEQIYTVSGHVFAVIHYILVPSFVVVLLSGLLALVATPAYMNAGWAWVKALLGLSVFEASLALSGSSREAADLSVQGAAGHDVVTQLAHAVRTETGVLWVLFVIGVINIFMGIWHPRFSRSQEST